jgi:hypothetical protein
MHYWDGEWKESRALIEGFERGAIARYGQHKVIFARDLNSQVVVDLEMPDGRRLQSRVAGLLYTDRATGLAAIIATTKSCIGEIVPPNGIIYRDAFAPAQPGLPVQASVRYTYTAAGLEQDILLLANPPSPLEYGLDPASAQLEVITEFLDPPPAREQAIILRREEDPVRRQQMAVPDLVDHRLDFGGMAIGFGQAFPLDEPRARQSQLPVCKQFTEVSGRHFLSESVEFTRIEPWLRRLGQAAAAPAGKGQARHNEAVKTERLLASLPTPAPSPAEVEPKPMLMASALAPDQGVAIDYPLNGYLTNHVFTADVTWVIPEYGYVELAGDDNVLEGGACIKISRTASGVTVVGTLKCETDPYRPAIVTARDDSTVGEYAATGPLTGYYGWAAFYFPPGSPTTSLHDLRIQHIDTAIWFGQGNSNEIGNLVVTEGLTGVCQDSGELAVRNALISKVESVTSGSFNPMIRWEHATIDQADYLGSGVTNLMTNCILTAVADTNGMDGAMNAVLTDSTGVYQTVGAGAYYLAAGSPWRDAGATNVSAAMAMSLAQSTTEPPMVLTNSIVEDTVLFPEVARDTFLPDLGYHYPVLDYAVSLLTISNHATLLITNGTCIGAFGSYGFWLPEAAAWVSEGTPFRRNQMVHYRAVQEQAAGWGDESGNWFTFITVGRTTDEPSPAVTARFTDFPAMTPGGRPYWHVVAGEEDNWSVTNSCFRDCRFWGGFLTLASPAEHGWGVTNTLFDRVQLDVSGSGDTFFYHNLLRSCPDFITLGGTNGQKVFRDNVFYGVSISDDGGITNDHNAYVSQPAEGDRLHPTNVTDMVLGSFTFEEGPLGLYYQPTNSALIDAGSRSAGLAGLAQFTSRIDQMTEGTNTVDLGLHYVAATNLMGVWEVMDSDGDGVPDYLEDLNGNGIVDAEETSPGEYDSPNKLVGTPGLQVFTLLK